jgi:UDP-glucose 4-epimerase
VAHLLITGGAGFIGSHTALVLLQAGHSLVVLDNFANSSPEALRRVAELAGLSDDAAAPSERLQVIAGDIRHPDDLDRALATPAPGGGPIDGVIHFAGLKAVGESVQQPLRYWDVNVNGSRLLLEAMQRHGCRTLVFSSSATLYGFPETVPIPETAPVQPINPYGHTKAAVEQLLADVNASESGWRMARLRYFNPVGAHPSGRIGEDPDGIPNNLFPFISQVAVGRRQQLQVFGGDWPTPDGTGVRDYIHVMDLAEGHRAALERLLSHPPELLTLNLGSGQGISVLELVAAFAEASGRPVPYTICDRRPGDAASTVADPTQAADLLGWRTQLGLADICRDGWAWQSANPQGYDNRTSV